jgi:hypothetical protein
MNMTQEVQTTQKSLRDQVFRELTEHYARMAQGQTLSAVEIVGNQVELFGAFPDGGSFHINTHQAPSAFLADLRSALA